MQSAVLTDLEGLEYDRGILYQCAQHDILRYVLEYYNVL